MNLSLLHQPFAAASASPYRLLDEQGQEVVWANAFLDAQRVRQLSPRSLRAYAYDLLHFARWLEEAPQSLSEITESTLLDYVRQQLDQEPKPSPQTVNHLLGVVHCLYRFHCGQEIPAGQSHFQRTYTKRSPLGYGRPRRGGSGPPLTATPACRCAAVGRRSRHVLAHLSRSRGGGPDVARWSAFLRGAGSSARRISN